MGSRYDDDDDDDLEDDEYRDRPSRRGRRRSIERPGKVQAIAIMTLIGGIQAAVIALVWVGMDISSLFCFCLWPGQYYTIVVAVMAIIKGAQLLGQDARSYPPPRGTAIMMIIDVINGDIVCCVLGILVLVFCSDPEVEDFFRG